MRVGDRSVVDDSPATPRPGGSPRGSRSGRADRAGRAALVAAGRRPAPPRCRCSSRTTSSDYERHALPAPDRPGDRRRPHPAVPHRAPRRARARRTAPPRRYARTLAARLLSSPRHRARRARREPGRARAAPAGCIGRVRRAGVAVGLVLPPALGPAGVRLCPLPPHLALRRRRAERATGGTRMPVTPAARRRRTSPTTAPSPPRCGARATRRHCTSTATRTTGSAGATRSIPISSICSRAPGVEMAPMTRTP